MAWGKTKPYEPGMIGSKPAWSFKRYFFPGSGRPPHSKLYQDTPSCKVIKTTPESQLDDDILPIASQFAAMRQTQDFSINGSWNPLMTGKTTQSSPLGMDTHLEAASNNGTQRQNAAPARVLQAQGPDPIPEHPISDSHAPLSSSPTPMFQHQFLTDDQMFTTAEVGDKDVPSSPDEPEDGMGSFLELPGEGVVSRVPDPVEAPSSPMMSNGTRSRLQSPAELSSSPRPPQANITKRADGVTQPVPGHTSRAGFRQFNGHTGTAQNEANAASKMAGQAARLAVKMNAMSFDDQRSTPKVNRVPVDSGNFQNSPSPNDSNGGTRQKEQRTRRMLSRFTQKRDSQDDKPKQLQKPDPQALNFDGFSDQKRVDVFLKDYKVPRNPRLDPLSTLLGWVELKLEESKKKEDEFNQQATSLNGQKKDIAKLRAELSSMQGAQGKWAQTQQKNQEQLENANKKINNLQLNLQKTRQAFATTKSSLDATVFERDQARTDNNQLLEEFKEKEQAHRNVHQQEMLRLRKEHAGQIETLRHKIKQEKDQAESRVAILSQDHRETIERMNTESKQKEQGHRNFHQKEMLRLGKEHSGQIESLRHQIKQERDQAESRIAILWQDHRATIERMEAESKEKDARHEILMMELQQRHDDAMNTQTRTLQDLRRHMANYSNTGSYTAISDDELRGHFQLLTRRINNLIKWVPRPGTYAVEEHLDPNGFLTRNSQQGGRNWPKFVRSICWRSIMRGFYCRQLGFDPSGLSATLPNTKELNTWRAGFFDALVKATQHGAIGQADNKYVRLFRANVESVTEDLVSSLQQVAQIRLDPGIWEEVAGFVEGLGTLALEMGSQRAHVYLETCEYGEDIIVGDRFRDDAELGYERLTVDLMTQPCLRRVGDGREDLTTQRTIVKGDFVALKPGVY
ncbi:hypothetical protein BGZ61DRAFT_559608 [Ilyonectria robusta]|uniref:uncharacterized protein n=1 Tax=Ilyonectria robusta TaxID=1079257 RepID=UPI001E8E19A4|nr:uncharacterized protein BGZ61DRAFT_559608 [Ilyonectria robusta]KAH8665637.1 hypothetical protein BGZ61DRAFT_559608 [Ilyonectria robusta]